MFTFSIGGEFLKGPDTIQAHLYVLWTELVITGSLYILVDLNRTLFRTLAGCWQLLGGDKMVHSG